MVDQTLDPGVVSTERWTPRRLHLAGLAAIVGGIGYPLAVATENLIYPEVVEMTGSVPYTLFFVLSAISAIGLLIGTAGLHAHQRELYGRLGLVGAAITGIGFASLAIATLLMALTADLGLVMVFGSIGFLGTPLGVSVLGIACWRAGDLSRLASGLFVLGLPALVLDLALYEATIALTGLPLSTLLYVVPFGIPWVLVGYRLRSRPTETSVVEPTAA